MTIVHLGDNKYQGVAADTKPTNVPNNSTFYETDTGSLSRRISGAWVEIAEHIDNYSFLVYKSGSNYKAKSGQTSRVISTSTSGVDTVVNDILTNFMGVGGGLIEFGHGDGTVMTINNPIVCPVNASTGLYATYSFIGVPSNVRGLANSISSTHFKASSTFPDGRSMIECLSAPASNKSAALSVRNLFMSTSNPVIVGAGGTQGNVGGIKFQNDANNSNLLHIENIQTDNLFRGIHAIGRVWGGSIRDVMFRDTNVNFIGDADIIFEYRDRDQVGGSDHGAGNLPAHFRIDNVQCYHSSGGSGTDGGFTAGLNDAIFFEGKYCSLRNIFVNGTKYRQSVLRLYKASSNIVDDVYVTDLNAVDPMNSILVLDSVDGSDPDYSYQTFDNKLYNLRLGRGSAPTYSVKFLNGAFKNEIHLSQFGTGAVTFNDTDAGIDNVAVIHEGQVLTSWPFLSPTQTSNKLTIRDKRASVAEVPQVDSYRRVGASPNRWYPAGMANGSALGGSTAVVTNFMYAAPFIATKPTTINAMGMGVITGVTSALLRIGIYRDDGNLYPSTRIAEVAELDAATSSTFPSTTASPLPITLTPGIYWFAVACSLAPTIRWVEAAGAYPLLGVTNTSATTTPGIGWSVAFTYAALPSTFTAGGSLATTRIPAIYARLT